MAEKLEDLARREAEIERDREAARQKRRAEADTLAKAVPERFFALASEIRACVQRFNAVAVVDKRLSLRESAALAARDHDLSGDLSVSFGRAAAEVVVALTQLSRAGRADAYLIEANGRLRADSFLLRAEAFLQAGRPAYRLSINLQRAAWPFDELAERLVRAAVAADVGALLA